MRPRATVERSAQGYPAEARRAAGPVSRQCLAGRSRRDGKAGDEGHRGWINYLAVAAEHQRTGLGHEIMAEAERLLRETGCLKINLQVRSTNLRVIEFYRSLGYIVEDVVSLGKRLDHDGPRP